MRSSSLIAILPFMALAACGTSRLGGAEDLQVVSSMPAPTATDFTAPGPPFLVGPLDRVKVDVYGMPALSDKEIQVDTGGQMSFPLVGALNVAGKSPVEVAGMIAAGLRQHYVRDPQVTVNLVETVSQVVTVEGEVRLPGVYPVVGQMTLLKAIARAQGTTEFTKASYIVLMRTVNGQKFATLYNLNAIREGKYQDPEIYANDVISVGESRARRIFRDVLQVAPLLSTPLIIALQNR